jgi:hypothetical protein
VGVKERRIAAMARQASTGRFQRTAARARHRRQSGPNLSRIRAKDAVDVIHGRSRHGSIVDLSALSTSINERSRRGRSYRPEGSSDLSRNFRSHYRTG